MEMALVLFGQVLRCLSVKFLPPPQYDGGEWYFILMPIMHCNVQYAVQVGLGTFAEPLSSHFLLSFYSGCLITA